MEFLVKAQARPSSTKNVQARLSLPSPFKLIQALLGVAVALTNPVYSNITFSIRAK